MSSYRGSDLPPQLPEELLLMKTDSYCLVETALGTCAIAWSSSEDAPPTVTFFQLPEATTKQTESRIARRCGTNRPSVPAPAIAAVIERVCRHLQGDIQD